MELEKEQTGLRENPPGSLAVQKTGNCVTSLGERIQECGLQCKDRDVDGECAKREAAETCKLLDHRYQQQQQQEMDVHKKQPDEELDPRIQVSEEELLGYGLFSDC